MNNIIQNYDWGSKTFIPDLKSFENSENHPYAELWMGDHHMGESKVLDEAEDNHNWIGLSDIIHLFPDEILGSSSIRKFGEHLPFLFKVLASDNPLSIQAHPTKEQARIGFFFENRMNIPVNDFKRNFKDKNHKPELMVALTPFSALLGFRSISGMIKELKFFNNIEEFQHFIAILKENKENEGKKDLFAAITSIPRERIRQIIRQIIAMGDINNPSHYWIKQLNQYYPGDHGVLAPLFLNIMDLAPGEAVFIKAGILHTYLKGAGIEIMANSDNVLRGGLTSKYVDIEELQALIDFSAKQVLRLKSRPGEAENEVFYKTPAKEFLLSKLDLNNSYSITRDTNNKVCIALCVSGEFSFFKTETSSKELLKKGESLLIPAATSRYCISGNGTLFFASIP